MLHAQSTQPRPTIAFDSEKGGEYQADLYAPDATATPVSIAQALTPEAYAHYQEHGWLSVKNVLSAAEVETAKTAIDDLILGRVEGFSGIYYENAVRDQIEHLTEVERYDAVRKLSKFAPHDARMRSLISSPTIDSINRNLLAAPAMRLFQDMALLKPPLIGREKPWHQDHAFFDFPLEIKFVGVWIAIDAATLANGCMQVLDRGHSKGPIPHFRRRDWQICDTAVLGKRSVAFPLEPGDAMFFDGLLPHGTPQNSSPDRRRALQFHYCPAEAQEGDGDFRLGIFGGEGRGATC